MPAANGPCPAKSCRPVLGRQSAADLGGSSRYRAAEPIQVSEACGTYAAGVIDLATCKVLPTELSRLEQERGQSSTCVNMLTHFASINPVFIETNGSYNGGQLGA